MTDLIREFGYWVCRSNPETQSELASLARETDPILRAEALFGMGLRLERSEELESAVQIYRGLSGAETAPGMRERAEARLQAILGQGNVLPRAEFLARSLARQASDPSAIFAMGAAGAVFRMTRLAVLSRLGTTPGASILTRGFGARLLSGTAGFLLEAPTFTLATRSANALLGREQDWSGSAVWREFAGGALTLLGLKVFGSLSGLAVQRWGRGSDLGSGALRALVPQMGMFSGILLSRRLEENLGLRDRRDGATEITDAFATLLQFHSGGRLAQEFFGEAWRSREHGMEGQGEAILRLPSLAATSFDPAAPVLALAMMSNDDGPRRPILPTTSRQLSLSFERPETRSAEISEDLRLAGEVDGRESEALRTTLVRLANGTRPLSPRDQIAWLREYGFTGGISLLGEMFRADTDHSPSALEALTHLAPLHREAVVSELRHSLNQNNVLLLSATLRALVQLRATEALEDLRARPTGKGAITALLETARIELGDTTLVPILRERGMKWQPSALDRIWALEALGRLGHADEAIAELRTFFRYSRLVYFRAGLALARLGAEAAIPNPAEMVETAETHENADLADAFWDRQRREQALDLSRRLLGSGDPSIRLRVLDRILEQRATELRPEVRRLTPDFQTEVRRRASEVLIQLARETQDRGDLQALLESSLPDSIRHTEALQIQAAEAWFSLDAAPAARQRLETLLDSSFAENRLRAAQVLMSAGPHPRARGILEALRFEPEARLRYRADRALQSSSRTGAAPGLGFPLATALGLGLGLSWLLDAAPAHASVLGVSSGESPGFFGLLGILTAGGIAMTALRPGRGEAPEQRDSDRPSQPNLLAWFDHPTDSDQKIFIPHPPENGILQLGRDTQNQANVFPREYRNISRRHMDLRVQAGQVEARVHDGSSGLRINGRNLAPFQWYQLRDRDVVEFVSQGSMDFMATVPSEDEPGEHVSVLHRLGRNPLEERDAPAMFIFRLPKPPPPPMSRPRRNILERVGSLFRSPAEPVQPTEVEAPRDSRPVAAFQNPEEIFAEINRFSSDLSSPLPLLESALRQPDWTDPNEERGRASRRDVLTALIRIHRRLCGNAEQVVAIPANTPGVARPSLQSIRVPQWDGILRQRLETYRGALDLLQRNRGNALQLEPARQELGHITDRLNRLFEMVRLFRRHFHEPEELARFEAIEAAYRGLRPEVRSEGQRVRSATRGLDVTVRRQQREYWAEEFSQPGRASRAILNMRILMGEIPEAHGIPISGNLYASLASGTIYEGNRSVRVHFDAGSGMIVAFEDGTHTAEQTVRRHRSHHRDIQEAMISIDAQNTGRITDVAILGEARDSIREALLELNGLRVLPPQVITGATGFQGDPGLRVLRVHLVPDYDAPPSQWHRVEGLARNVQPGWSLLTLEPTTPVPGQMGVQLWVPSMEILDVSLGDPVTLQPDS